MLLRREFAHGSLSVAATREEEIERQYGARNERQHFRIKGKNIDNLTSFHRETEVIHIQKTVIV